jgi:hypothetical protein
MSSQSSKLVTRGRGFLALYIRGARGREQPQREKSSSIMPSIPPAGQGFRPGGRWRKVFAASFCLGIAIGEGAEEGDDIVDLGG